MEAVALSDQPLQTAYISDGHELHFSDKPWVPAYPNVRDYFAASDMGFLPSRFKGESAPLVLIDCLLSGKPVLASDIGEIRHMLDSDDGLAGELVDLEEWEIPVEATPENDAADSIMKITGVHS